MYNNVQPIVVASPMEMFWYNQLMSGDMGIFGWVMFGAVFLIGYLILISKYQYKLPKWIGNHMLGISIVLSIVTSVAIVKSGLFNWVLVHLF